MNCKPFIDEPMQTLKQGGEKLRKKLSENKKGGNISKIIFFKVITLITKLDKELQERKIISRFYLVNVDAEIKYQLIKIIYNIIDNISNKARCFSQKHKVSLTLKLINEIHHINRIKKKINMLQI